MKLFFEKDVKSYQKGKGRWNVFCGSTTPFDYVFKDRKEYFLHFLTSCPDLSLSESEMEQIMQFIRTKKAKD